jgi:hypothetical protein
MLRGFLPGFKGSSQTAGNLLALAGIVLPVAAGLVPAACRLL